MSRNSSPPPRRPSKSKGDPAADFVSLLEQGVLNAVGAPESVVLAVSGGADSTAMLHGWLESKTLTKAAMVAHFDHRLRPESSTDAEWVRSKAESLGLQCEIGEWDEPATGESAARQARLQFLTRVAEAHQGAWVVTAHTRDDQAETVLFRVIRGTGVDGLRGIPARRRLSGSVSLLRPMLRIERALGRRFLQSRGLEWRDDPSNGTLDFARNRLRNELIPWLAERYNPRIVDALVHLSESAADQGRVLDVRVEDLWETIERGWSLHPDEASLPWWGLEYASQAEFKQLLRTLFRKQHWPMGRMSADHWNRLAGLIDANRGTHWEGPDGMTAETTAAAFIIRRKR